MTKEQLENRQCCDGMSGKAGAQQGNADDAEKTI